jgi:hypothetical protein
MIPVALETLGSELRKAAAHRRYADVNRLAVQLGSAAAQMVGSLPAGDPAIRQIAAWLSELFKSTEILVRISRAAQADQLRQAVFVQRYMARQTPRPSQLRMQL